MSDTISTIEQEVSAELAAAFSAAGLPAGVSLLAHSGIMPIMSELRRRGLRGSDLRTRSCACFDAALTTVLGAEGTVCVPGFFYNYARKGLTFDLRQSEPDDALGAFPQYFHRQRMEHRSLNPLVSLMMAGPKAEWIAAAPSVYGNGEGSPWPRLVADDGWMLFIGTTPATMTFTHHVEQLVGVPHLYNKIYRIPIVDLAGQRHDWSLCSVRFLDPRFGVVYRLDNFIQGMIDQGILVQGKWGSVPFSLARFQPVQRYLAERLIADPYFLLEKVPGFVRGCLPDDGPSAAQDVL